MDVHKLYNGVEIPGIFLGTWNAREQSDVDLVVLAAVNAGYRGIDSAACYQNEAQIRIAIENCGASRSELFVTSKLWNNGHGYDNALKTFDITEKKLGRVDLYLIHWPGPVQSFLETWKAMERLYEEKRVRAIGVSNFMLAHLEALLADCRIKPMVNQFEAHLYHMDYPLIRYCFEKEIKIQAFSPLSDAHGLLEDETLIRIANKYGKTPAQTALRFLVQQGLVPVPKSVKPARIAENMNIFDFTLEDEDMRTLKNLNRLQRTNKDPFKFFDMDYK